MNSKQRFDLNMNVWQGLSSMEGIILAAAFEWGGRVQAEI